MSGSTSSTRVLEEFPQKPRALEVLAFMGNDDQIAKSSTRFASLLTNPRLPSTSPRQRPGVSLVHRWGALRYFKSSSVKADIAKHVLPLCRCRDADQNVQLAAYELSSFERRLAGL